DAASCSQALSATRSNTTVRRCFNAHPISGLDRRWPFREFRPPCGLRYNPPAIRRTRSRSGRSSWRISAPSHRAPPAAGPVGGAALGGGAAALGGSDALAQASARKTFVLVHGAYHGGWCWRKVVDILEKHGHKVYAPSLTGLADRSHLLSMNLKLDTHIADIANLFKWEDVKDACLVPHSYGGWPASGALEELGDRVAAIVSLHAFMPKDGERSTDTISEFSRKALVEAMAKGEPGRKPPKASQYSISEKDYAWMDSKLTAQPNSITDNPIKLTGALQKVARKTYI